MPKNAASLVVNKTAKLLEGLRSLSSDVLVGVPAEKGIRNEEGQGMNNATLAFIHDNGSPAANIPARPFMRPGIIAAKEKITSSLRAGAVGAMHGESSTVERALNVAGLAAQSSIRATINAGIEPALAPSTIAARKAKGQKGEKPLIRTGQLRNSINYVVRKK
jgi:phage gpG-like protein